MLLLTTAICWLLVPCVALLSAILYHRIKYFRRTKRKTWAFFHPYCSSGGGGERVLWKMVQVLSDLHYKGWHVDVVIYTVDPPSPTYKQGR
jgi:alpha-1,2-mannosyltransferase